MKRLSLTDQIIVSREKAKHIQPNSQNGLTTDPIAKELADKAAAEFQKKHHPKRVTIVVPTWNGKPVFHSGG